MYIYIDRYIDRFNLYIYVYIYIPYSKPTFDIFPHVLKDQPTLHREKTSQNLLGEEYFFFNIHFF